MKNKIVVRVDMSAIFMGKRKQPGDCAIAKAIKGGMKFKNVTVLNGVMTIGGRTYALPKKAKDFIKAFDKGEAVIPFSFAAEEV